MTICKPRQQNNILSLCIVAMVCALFVGLWTGITYLQTVGVRHDLAEAKKQLENAVVENAELKSEQLRLTDATNLEKVAQARGLIKEKNPQWVFAASHF